MKAAKMLRRVVSGVLIAGLGLALSTPMTGFAKVTKQESVYVIANADGSTKSVTVSDQLQGAADESGDITDVSDLSEIKNVKGDEKFDQNGNKLTWHTAGADIFYQGKTDKELPVSVKITYSLDGKEMAAKDIVGKSGKLVIKVKYENKTGENKMINGKSTKIVTPFIMATGLILDNEHFTDVKIEEGGKVIDDGSKSIVICLGMPGLKDSLNLSKDLEDKIGKKMNDEFEIKCNTTDFEMKNTFTFASPNLLNSLLEGNDDTIDLDKIDDKIGDLDDAVDKLADGTGKLKDGVKKLDDGSKKLTDGMKKYVNDGVKKLTGGIKELGNNAPKLKKGVGEYVDGVDQLSDGVTAYVNGSGQLTDGIKTIANGMAAMDMSQINTLLDGIQQFAQGIASATSESDMKKLAKGSESVSDGIGTVNSGLKQLKESYSNNDTAITALKTSVAANEKVLEGLKAAKAGGAQGLDTAIATLEQTVKGDKQAIAGLETLTKEQKSGVEKLESATSSSGNLGAGAKTVSESVTKLTDGLIAMSKSENVQALKAGVAKLSEKLPALMIGVTALKSGAEKLSANDKKLIAGATALKKASKVMKTTLKKLSSGMTQLSDGAKKLDSASDQVVSGADKLGSGTGQLFDGAKKLDDGFAKFREKAIDKLMDFYNDDIKGIVDSLQEITDAGKKYKSFAGIDDGMGGEVKFIIETEAVKADDKE